MYSLFATKLQSWRLGLTIAVMGFALAACKSKSSTVQTATGDVALPTASSAASGLLSSLTGAVPGLSTQQAALGAGALFGLAKTKMPADQFAKISQSVPGTDALVSEAVKAGVPSQPSSLSSLTASLSKFGISPDQVSRLVPALGSAVGKVAGPDVGNALTAVLK